MSCLPIVRRKPDHEADIYPNAKRLRDGRDARSVPKGHRRRSRAFPPRGRPASMKIADRLSGHCRFKRQSRGRCPTNRGFRVYRFDIPKK
jgi:hypothetical protein